MDLHRIRITTYFLPRIAAGMVVFVIVVLTVASQAYAANADVRVSVSSAPERVVQDELITYVFRVYNGGPAVATAVQFGNELPENLQFVSASTTAGTCIGGQTVSCSIGGMDPSAAADVTVVAKVIASGEISNTATVTSAGQNDPDLSNNSATAITKVDQIADVMVAIVGAPNRLAAEASLTYTISVTNLGPHAANEVNLNMQMAATELVFAASTSSQGSCSKKLRFQCELGTIASGQTVTVTVGLIPVAAGVINNTASAQTASIDPVTLNNAAVVSTTVTAAPNSKPSSKLAPIKKKLARKRLLRHPLVISGTAHDNAGLKAVDVAVLLATRGAKAFASTHRRSKRHCNWLGGVDGTFRLVPPDRRKRCSAPVWLRANGTTNWRMELKKALPVGRYTVYSRATDSQGLRESVFSDGGTNRLTFRVR